MNTKQLSLFDNHDKGDQYDELPLEPLDLDSSLNDEDDEIEINRELLTIRLFKQAVKEANYNDLILNDFAEYILPNLLLKLAGVTAKGGQFTEDRKAEGKNTEKSKYDQSLISHILNGLFPTYRIIKLLLSNKVETNPVKRHFNELIIKLFLASFPLHDFEKDPHFQEYLAETVPEFKDRNWRKDTPKKKDAPNLSRDYVKERMQDLGIDLFLGENWEKYIDDIVWLSHNAGDGNDADRGLQTRGLEPILNGRVRQPLHQLLQLSDLFVSIIKHPKDIVGGSKFDKGKLEKCPVLLSHLSQNQLQFTYHALSDNRGVITNIINNALITAHGENYKPLLYLPDGVIYVSKIDAPKIDINNIAGEVIKKIKTLCATQLIRRQTGFSRGGKGLKFAEYYWLFFEPIELMKVAIKVAQRIFPEIKKACSQKRSESLEKFKAKGELSNDIDVSFDNDIRIDRLAEFGDIICRGIWNQWREKAQEYQKQFPKKQRQEIPELNIIYHLAEYLDLKSEIEAIKEIQSFKKTGGVPLDWYYLAGKYYQTDKGKGQDFAQTIELMEGMVNHVQTLINPIIEQFEIEDGWGDLKTYVNDIISLPMGKVTEVNPESFFTEIDRYHKAKITGRKRENVCAMSSSSYTVSEQMESGSLFAPQVYSNRQILFNTQAAKRQICSIWATEIMLRQILMNNTNSIGADFENRKYRYLYLYPAYFFTPETSLFLRKAYDGLEKTRFDAELRKHFITEKQKANLTIENYQQVDDLLIKPDLNPEDDHTFKLNYSTDDPITFFFVALPPPGRDATDTESWVMPTWLAFALPLVADVKVVVSESPVPPFLSGADFEETVLLDGTHQAIKSLVKCDRYRLDLILPRNQQKFSPLNALTCAYAIHLEVNRKKDGNPNWGKLSDLARDLETNPLYVFHYLSKWLRKQNKFDVVPTNKIKLYQKFYYCFDNRGQIMTKLEKLTNLYRKFYRSKKRYAKANAILKPIDNIAETILKADKSWSTEELLNITTGNLASFMNNVRRRTAEGKPTLVKVDGKWKPALTQEEERQAVKDFATFFVEEIFIGQFKSDRSRLAGKQLNLIRNTCEYLYRLADDEEKQVNKEDEPDELIELQTEEV